MSPLLPEAAKGQPRVIVAFGAGTWRTGNVFGSPRYHLWNLSRIGWKVLYVEPPVKFHFKSRLHREGDRGEFHVLTCGGVWPFGVRGVRNASSGEWWRRRVSKQLLERARWALKQLGWADEPNAWWFGAPWHSVFLDQVNTARAATVSHCYDELSYSPIFTPVQRDLLWQWERELVRGVDVALCSSQPQYARRNGVARKTLLLENAVADDHLPGNRGGTLIAARDFAQKIAALPEPRILYAGTVDLRLDVGIYDAVMAGFPKGSLIFCGHIDRTFPKMDLWKLKAAGNVHFFGDVPYAWWPYIHEVCHVLILAHKRTPFTDPMYPEKLNEYLASGKPIVSVTLPEVGRLAREARRPGAVRTADTPTEFVKAINDSLRESDPGLVDARLGTARLHTWSLAAEKLDRELNLHLATKAK